MSAAPSKIAQANRPDPHQVRPANNADEPGRGNRLLGLVRALIDYGKQLATTLQQRTVATDLFGITLNFGTKDIELILSRITRGLLRAAALEARLIKRLARDQAAAPVAPVAPVALATRSAPSRRQPPAAPHGDQDASTADPRLARLPTPDAIAADVRRRPIGAVIADICRDLGIVPAHPLWREIHQALNANRGNYVALYIETTRRLFTQQIDPPTPEHRPAPAPRLPSSVTHATGPP